MNPNPDATSTTSRFPMIYLVVLFISLFLPQICGLLSLAQADTFTCTPQDVAVFDSRVHVRCTAAAPGGIVFFAYPNDDTARASQVLSVLSTALAAGRQLSIIYDPADTSGDGFGCWSTDCRAIQGVSFQQ